jgi:hypothetical protein
VEEAGFWGTQMINVKGLKVWIMNNITVEILPRTLCECGIDNLLFEDFLQDWKSELFTETFGSILTVLRIF